MTRDQRGRSHDRRGRFTAERTTTTVTERLTIDHDDDTGPVTAYLEENPDIPWAPGWDRDLLAERQEYRDQRDTQADRCLQYLWDAVVSAEMTAAQTGTWDNFAHQLPGLMRAAKVILRAGPGATPLELTAGKSV